MNFIFSHLEKPVKFKIKLEHLVDYTVCLSFLMTLFNTGKFVAVCLKDSNTVL